MSYTRTTWIARVGTALNRFLKTNEDSPSGTVELTNDPTGVTTAGTPFTVANMNKIEDGIYDAHVTADANASNLLANVNQGVKTTDSPTFESLSILHLINSNNLKTKSLEMQGAKILILPTTTKTSFSRLNCYGLAFDGTNLISCDTLLGEIYIHVGLTSSVSSTFSGTGDVYGLTFDGINLISCDVTNGMIYIHDGISATILSSFASPDVNPSGLTFDGTNLISCDEGTNKIYVHDGITSTILYEFTSPATNIKGLAFDGTNLISCDEVSPILYIHDGISSTILKQITSPAGEMSALTWANGLLLSASRSSSLIYKHTSELGIITG